MCAFAFGSTDALDEDDDFYEADTGESPRDDEFVDYDVNDDGSGAANARVSRAGGKAARGRSETTI